MLSRRKTFMQLGVDPFKAFWIGFALSVLIQSKTAPIWNKKLLYNLIKSKIPPKQKGFDLNEGTASTTWRPWTCDCEDICKHSLSLSFIISRLMRWVPALCKNVVRTKWRSPQGPSLIWTMHDANPIHHAQIFVDICPCSSACMALVRGYLTCLSNNSETVWSIALHCICFYLLVKEKLLKLAIRLQKKKQTGSTLSGFPHIYLSIYPSILVLFLGKPTPAKPHVGIFYLMSLI